MSGNGWLLDNSSIIKQIANTALKEQIAAATDIALKKDLEVKMYLINGTRILLLSVFVGVSVLVHIAYKKRIKQGGF